MQNFDYTPLLQGGLFALVLTLLLIGPALLFQWIGDAWARRKARQSNTRTRRKP